MQKGVPVSTQLGLHRPSRPRWALLALLTTLLLTLGLVAPAAAEDVADSLVVNGEVAADGTLSVQQTFTFPAGAAPAELVQRLATTRQLLQYTQLEYEITDVTATAGGQDLAPQLSTDGDYQVITVDTSEVGDEPVELSYTVSGAAVAQSGEMTQVAWRVVQGLNIDVREVSGEIVLPQGAQTSDITCQAGDPNSPVSCSTYASGTFDAPYPRFTNGALGKNGMVALSFTVPSSTVAPNQVITEQWTLGRAFSAAPLPLALALGALALGAAALYWLLRSRGGDVAAAKPTMVAHFEPVGAGEERFDLELPMLPGEVGTLMDERVDPIDITATIVDLAQRDHLTIVELPLASPHAPHDWTFERGVGRDELHAYERTLLDAIAPAEGQAATVSHIGEAVRGVVEDVQEEIYTEVVNEGWFAARPDDVRSQWSRISIGAVIASLVVLGLLIAFTNFGLLGLALVCLAVGLMWVGQQMPRRTAKGTSVLRGLEVLAMNLQTQPTDHVPKADAYAEISRVLPYAIVLGGSERWLHAMVEADNDPGVPDPDDLGWYRAPETWQLSDLPASLDAFITTMEGKLYGRG